MIVIVSKDKDFSHTLAEQVVRELGEPCECVDNADELTRMCAGDIRLVIASDIMAQDEQWPQLCLKAPIRLQNALGQIQALISKHETSDEITFADGFAFLARLKEIKYLRSGKTVKLTDKEAQLLAAMLQDEIVSKDVLLKKIWGFEADLNTHTLETHIYRLRAKFKELSGSEMIAIGEQGYRIRA